MSKVLVLKERRLYTVIITFPTRNPGFKEMWRIFWWRVKEMELTGCHFRQTGNTGERKKSRDRQKGTKESPERPHLTCFTSAINPDSAKGHTALTHIQVVPCHVFCIWYLARDFHFYKGSVFSVFSNGMWSSSGVPKPCWRGSCKNILQTSSYRKGEQTQELDDLSEQQKSSRNIPKWYQILNELTSGFHRWLCPGQILDENSLG